MDKNLDTFATWAGAAGIGLGVLSALLRVLGLRSILGYETLTLLIGAIALMAASCVVQLHLLRRR